MWSIIAGLVGNVFKGVTDSYQKKQELKDAKHKRELDRIVNNEEAAGRADEISLAKRGWSDEYLLLMTTLPVLCLFLEPIVYVFMSDAAYQYGDMQKGVVAGFEALKVMPEYVWYGLAAIYIDVFGFRRMLRLAIENIIAKKVSKM